MAEAMSPEDQLGHLERLAGRLGIKIRYERFDPMALGPRGGLCRVHETKLFVADELLTTVERVTLLAEALSSLEVEAMYVPPILRRRLRRAC